MTNQPKPDQEPLCSRCGLRPRRPGQRWCKVCFAEYMREARIRQTTIRLDDDVYEYLRKRSFAEHKPISRLINTIIRDQAIGLGITRMAQAAKPPDEGGGEVSRETKRA